MTSRVQPNPHGWLAPGCCLDRYDLLLQVAEGGMGLLWLARQQGKHGFERIVAIKTILPKLASDAGFRQMFLDEARVVSRIEHPNVAQVLDLGEERGVLFLVMEWIDGESLNKVGRAFAGETEVQLPVGVLARIMVDVCAGLHAAHEITDEDGVPLGVVHRDVSPHNLLVGFRGTTKVIDFGIAKARNRVAQDTSVGLVKGKIAYMAPEQAMGVGVDRRTDVWSAGASMYRFLVGRVPYDAPEPLVMLRRLTDGLPPAPVPMTVPEPIRVVVQKALELDPENRFATARDMGAALERAMRDADCQATHADVAAFMADHLGEGRATRTQEIEHAVRESRARMRVEVARAEIASQPDLPIAHDVGTDASPVRIATSPAQSAGLEWASGGPGRPSGRPTAMAVPQPEFRLSGRPTAVSQPQPSAGANEAPPGRSREFADTVRPPPSELAPAAAPTGLSLRVRRQVFRSRVQGIAAGCLLATLLAGGFAWRAAHPPGRSGAADGPAPAPRPAPAETSTPAAGEPPAGAPSSALAPAVPAADPTAPEPAASGPPAPGSLAGPSAPAPSALDPAASAAASGHPRDLRASAAPNTPDHVSADDLLERARHARRAGRLDDAAALFAAAVQQTPTDSEALSGLADVDEAQGATALAIASYRRALAVNPRYLPARLGLADALWTSGQRDEARAAYRSIVAQVPPSLCPDVARQRAAVAAPSASP